MASSSAPRKRQSEASASEGLSARKKGKQAADAPFTVDQPVTLQAGNGRSGHRVYIHRRRLNKVSPWFSQNAPNNKILKLEDVSAHTLQAFYSWVYDEVVEIEGMQQAMDAQADVDGNAEAESEHRENAREDNEQAGSDSNAVSPLVKIENANTEEEEEIDPETETPATVDNGIEPWYMSDQFDSEDRIFGRLLDVYLFSIEYEIPGLKFATILAWQRFYYNPHKFLDQPMITGIYERVPADSGLLKFLIHAHAFEWKLDEVQAAYFKGLPSDFLAEVIVVALKRTQSKDTMLWPGDRWCDFHEHDTKEEETACQTKPSRQQDRDMVKQGKIAETKAEASRVTTATQVAHNIAAGKSDAGRAQNGKAGHKPDARRGR